MITHNITHTFMIIHTNICNRCTLTFPEMLTGLNLESRLESKVDYQISIGCIETWCFLFLFFSMLECLKTIEYIYWDLNPTSPLFQIPSFDVCKSRDLRQNKSYLSFDVSFSRDIGPISWDLNHEVLRLAW